MKVKELQKIVNVAWSPDELVPIYLATGSAAQQLDSNGSSLLEIYATNLNEPGYDLELKASLPSQYRFQKLIWSPSGYGSDHPNGLLVGGCENGNLMVYDTWKMLNGDEGLIARQESHTGTVRGLDFNPFQTNLLASVASESEIFVWDLNNTTTHMTPGTKSQPIEDVQNVAWNRQVQHILASVFSSRCVVWDLRKNEQIIKLSDTQSRVRWRAVQWHPDVATQIWLASEEDQAPVVQMWDLRYATAPAKTMQIHQRGVLSMSWCSKDSDMIVSCGKDNRIYCWNPNTNLPEGEILCEVAVTSQWYSDVQWCPKNPALIASSCLDGNVSIYSLFGGAQQQVLTSNKIADSFPGMDQLDQVSMPPQGNLVKFSDPLKPPKWMKKKCGVKFGFGGKLVSFSSKSMKIQQVVSDKDFLERAAQLESSLAQDNLIEFCRKKADDMSNQDDRYIWYFLKANFEPNPKEEILNLLGYNTEDIKDKFAKYLKTENESLEQITNQFGSMSQKSESRQEDLEFSKRQDKTCKNSEESEDLENLISEAILTGNLIAAIELCFETNRAADALIIASTISAECLANTQERFLKQRESDLSNIISALVSHDWMEFATQSAIDSWKKVLVAVLKHGDRNFVDICEKLGDRLLTDNTRLECTKNALLCFICAGHVDKVINAWNQIKRLEKENMEYELDNIELQELAEIIMVLYKSLERQGIHVELEGKFAEITHQYGSLLAALGGINNAVAYFLAIGHSNNPKLNDLRERLNKIIAVKTNTENLDPCTANNSYYGMAKQRGSFSTNFSPSNQIGTLSCESSGINNLNRPPPPPVEQSSNPVLMFNYQTENMINPNQILPPSVSATAAKPPIAAQPYEGTAQPPRTPSVGSQSSTQMITRSKYLLDPSVSSAYSSQKYGSGYNQSPALPSNNFNTMPISQNPEAYNSNQTQLHSIPLLQNNYTPVNSMPPLQNAYLHGIAPIEAAPPKQKIQQIQRNPTPPPGWNDPPLLKSNKHQLTKKEPSGSAITHPIFGTDRNQNAYLYPSSSYQNQTMPLQQHLSHIPFNAGQQNNNMLQNDPRIQTPSALYPNMNQQHTGYQEQPTPVQRLAPESPKEKLNLPEEFIYMKTLFEELKDQCLAAAPDPRTKRKFVDVAKRLENLYDCLRDRRLTPNTIEALNQIVQCIQIGDYGNALTTHTSIAFGTDFAQTASFMPGIKVLIQSASDLKVFLR